MRAFQLVLTSVVCVLVAKAKPIKSSAKTISLPLHRQWRPPVAFDGNGLPPLPLTAQGLDSLVYTVQVLVGNPAQHFNLTLDINAQSSVLFAKGFTSTNHSCSRGDAKRNLFDVSQSKTYVQWSDSSSGWGLYRYPYVGVECHQGVGWAETLNGVQAEDTFSLLSFAVPNVTFILANHTYWPLNPRWLSDGIFPLGNMPGETISDILYGLGGMQEISLWLNSPALRGGSAGAQAAGGVITFGGKDTQNCASNWTTISANQGDWSIFFSSVWVGAKVIYNGGASAEFSVSSPFLEVPSAYYRQVVNAFNAKYDHELDLYTIDCSVSAEYWLPGIQLSLGAGAGVTYTVPLKDFVAELPTKAGTKCALLIVQSANGWVFGSQFLPKRCLHLDYANSAISFADPISK